MGYLLTPRSRVLLEKLTGLQLVKKFPAFYEIRRFITEFTSSRHLSLSWASSIQSIPPLLSSYKRISPGPRLCLWILCNKIRFNRDVLLAPRPTPKREVHPLSAVPTRQKETTIKGKRHKKYPPRNKVPKHIESCGKQKKKTKKKNTLSTIISLCTSRSGRIRAENDSMPLS